MTMVETTNVSCKRKKRSSRKQQRTRKKQRVTEVGSEDASIKKDDLESNNVQQQEKEIGRTMNERHQEDTNKTPSLMECNDESQKRTKKKKKKKKKAKDMPKLQDAIA